MSDRTYALHAIVEGPSDAIVLQEFAAAILGTERIQWTTLQPETSLAFGDAGPHGGGWKGVRGKCREIAEHGGVVASGSLANADSVIVQLDGEVAAEREVGVPKPCPPAMDTALSLDAVVRGWLGADSHHAKVVVAVATMETEAWLIPALRPLLRLETTVECTPKPSKHFRTAKPRLVEQCGKKRTREYRRQRAAIRSAWQKAKALTTAARFADDLLAAVGQRLGPNQAPGPR